MNPRINLRTPLGILFNADDGGGGGTPPTPTPPPAAPAKGPGTDANKPLSEMTDGERASYFEKRSDRFKETLRSFGNLTPESLTALQEKAARADALDFELSSGTDKAAKLARDEATREAIPRVVRSEFKAAAKGILTAEQLTALLEDRDLSKYADAKGEPNEDKIEKLVKAFAPATPSQRGPSANGLGARTPPASNPGDQGRAMAAKRFGTKTS